MSRVKFTFRRDFQQELYGSFGTREALQYAVKRIDARAKGDAPRRPSHRTSWNSIAKQIGSGVFMDRSGWYGGIWTEANPRARHAMLQERGFTTPRGRKIAGLHWLKGALLKARVDG